MANVMIVDDAQINIDILRNVLHQKYKLSFAKNGEKALEIMRKRKPDLVLLDIMMPKMNGFAVIEEMKKDDFLNDIPVIFITAQSSLEEKTKGLELGAVDYITKPFQPLEVKARVDVHINLLLAKRDVDELLSKTLIGAVGICLELEKNMHPLIYSLSYRIKSRSQSIAKRLGISNLWIIELSGLLSLMGMIYMNPVSAENIVNGKFVGSKDLGTYKMHTQYGSDLVSKIPRLESVSEVISLLGGDIGNLPFDRTNENIAAAQIIKAVIHYEMEVGKGMDPSFVLRKMRGNTKSFSGEVINAIEEELQ